MTAPQPSAPRLKLGFNARIAFPSTPDGARRALRDGIELFRRAEALGFDSGWVYQRHFDNYLASPFPFLSAVAQHTTTIRLGTAIVAIRYEDPYLLAENAATTDLLSAGEDGIGRLELAIGKGGPGFDHLFGDRTPGDVRVDTQRKLSEFLAAVRGEIVGVVTEKGVGVPEGTPLRTTPYSPGLANRIWYGAGSHETAALTARHGLDVILGTIVHADVTDSPGPEGYDGYQRAQIDAFTAESRNLRPDTASPRVALSRSVLPVTSTETAELYRAYDEERQAQGPAASRPQGALAYAAAPRPSGLTVVPVYRGEPSEVVESLRADLAFQASGELVLFLPPAFTLDQNTRLLEDVAAHVAPELGWVPAVERSLVG